MLRMMVNKVLKRGPIAHALHALRATRLGLIALGTAMGLHAPLQAADCPGAPAVPDAAQVQQLLTSAVDRGELWRIERDGRVGWLYGTLHLGRMPWVFPGPRLTAALREASQVALELDASDPAVLQDINRAMAATGRATNGEPVALPEPLLQRLAQRRAAECADGLATLPPLQQTLALVLLHARRSGLDLTLSQEQMLTGFARAAGKPLRSLESAERQLASLQPETPQALVSMIEGVLAQIESGQSTRLIERMAQAWAEGRTPEFERYTEWCECADTEADRRLLQNINDARNPGLADAIEALVAGPQGRPTLAAVGVLHLYGDQALPRLLRQRGWQLQRLVPAGPTP